ncbi:tetratricopeptide repeat protein [bacterium BMS3Bbin12]|nr:tetratricopeptide repeat protein [bacterium BMS3Abin12]GBE48098.1 tetratricopeptide repeat protein [bacterium BMS3Bbin12]GBE50067.1 tetratricopeptide repeat protein [bacterium BMS3Bbin13]HDK02359.1 hypothetical protein [Gammaproteobacteria bacterium]
MNRRNGALAPVLLALLLAACAQVAPWTSGRPAHEGIERLIADDRYGDALAALRNIPPDAPDAAELRAKRLQVRAQAARYAARRLAAAGKAEQAGNWHQAEKILRDTLDHDPGAKDVRTTLHNLHARRVHRVREIEHRMLIARGEWLSREIPARKELKRITSFGLLDRLRLAELDYERRKVAEKLLAAGTDAMRTGELDDARQCLTLSQTLNDAPPVRTALERLARLRQEQQRLEEVAQQRNREQDLRRRKARLHDQVQEAIADGEWRKAQASLRKLMKLDPDNRELTSLKKALDEAVAVRIRQLLDKGNALYRQGRIREAKTAWEAVLALDPEQQQAQANVKRARRVLNKLRELKRQAPKTPPAPAS